MLTTSKSRLLPKRTGLLGLLLLTCLPAVIGCGSADSSSGASSDSAASGGSRNGGGTQNMGGSGTTTAGGSGTAGVSGALGGAPGAAGNPGSSMGGAGNPGPSTGGAGASIGGAGTSLDPLPGVVVVDTQKGTKTCVPLCRIALDPALDPEMDDYSFENGQSCIIPSTPTSKNQSCTTGEPLPPPPSVPGVVVVQLGTTSCAPLCTITTSLAQDPDKDGWSYENNASCVIPGTVTASNDSCKTGDPIPPPTPRPGLLVNLNTDPNAECVPVCKVVTVASDPTAPDWGYEDNASCLLPTSATAKGKLACTFNAPAPSYKPPLLTGTTLKAGFYTQGGTLFDPYGKPFVIRGVNNADIYFDTSARYLAWQALDNIATYNTNAIRVVWDTTGTASLLAEVLYRVVSLKMVPIVELHDVTGNQDASRLLDMAKYYTRADVKQVLLDFRQYLLINIANEWSGQGNYAAAYQAAIAELRTNGVNHTLVIDGSGFGQDSASIFANAAALTTFDTQSNLLFSLHMYDVYANPATVDSVLNQANSAKVPLIVGEFGPQLNGMTVAWQEIMAKCRALNLGYIAWSWMGNDALNAPLNMAQDWEGPLTTWGRDVLTGTNGIQQTAVKASIFN